jgi:hypothetical protein
MADQDYRVKLEAIDWRAALPFLRLFGAFRMAIQPGRLMLALMLVLLVYLGGTAMDFAWGPRVYPNEVQAYAQMDAQRFDTWLEGMRSTDDPQETGPPRVKKGYIFNTLVEQQVGAFERLVVSATALDFGFTDLASGMGADSGGVIGALASMVVGIPGWLYATHPGFLLVFLLYAFALTSLVGGAICRVAALDACRGEHISAFAGLRFALNNWVQIMLAPLIPLGLVVVIRLALALAGWVLFSLPGADVLGAVLFGLMLLGGFIAAMLLIGLALGVNLLTPGIAIEATDAFDAVSRAYNYVVGRPWRYVFYTAVMIVYGAVTYLLIGLVVFSTIWFTKDCLSAGAVGEIAQGKTRLDAIMPDPQWGRLLPDADWAQLGGLGTVAAALVMVWLKLLIAVLPAFAVSYYFNAQTWVYLLLRRSADLVEFDEVYAEPDPDDQRAVQDKVEPVKPADATGP